MSTSFDVQKVRQDFPILNQQIHGHPLVYLDNAATSQKPRAVIEAQTHYSECANANIHRGVHLLSELSTQQYETVREKIKQFIHAEATQEIIFVRGATEAINLVMHSYGRAHVRAGDEVLISELEHHSNIVPWQILCEQTGATLRIAPINDAGEVILEDYQRLLNSRTKLVALAHISNALGTINPIKKMIAMAHAVGAVVLIDGAQAAPHLPIDVQALDCDFYAFSGHKMYAPTGIGVLYGKQKILETMSPYQSGGNMIREVSFKQKTTFAVLPQKFEAGTPNIAGVIGLGAAVDYLNQLGLQNILAYENELLRYATAATADIKGMRLVGTAAQKASILSFTLDHAHPHDVGTILDRQGIAIRAGHHCSMPIMERYGIPATVRASLAFYNTREEIDRLVMGLHKVREIFC